MHRESEADRTRHPTRLRRVLPWLLLAAVVIGAWAGLSTDAWARVGGGQGFSGGGGGYSGGGYSGGGYSGGGGGSGLIELLGWLIIRHPAIGIPVTLAVVGFVIWSNAQQRDRGGGAHGRRSPGSRHRGRRATPGVDPAALTTVDPNFSEPLFIDFVQLVYARVQRARGDGDLAPLRPLVTDGLRQQLATGRGDLTEVKDIIFGGTRLVSMRTGKGRLHLVVDLETNITEVRADQHSHRLRKERWTFGRKLGVLSPGPERMRSLDCPSCGSSLEPDTHGRCPNCGAVRTGREAVQWVVERIAVLTDQPLRNIEVHQGGGVEPGTRLPTRKAPDLAVQIRALETRHPQFSWAEFDKTVTDIFLKLQQAWSDQRWELARPYETDALFQVHRFWMERYAREGLVNRLDKVEVQRIERARIGVDAFYEAITVRIFASMLDWTERVQDGKVIGGSDKEPRVFSEYWTFIRRIGGKAHPAGGGWDAEHCPSCGAPLDKVSQAGVCGYCDAKITTGDFDWILSRIEQDESYQG